MVASEKMSELMGELNQDKDYEKMIYSDCKIGDVYKERVQVGEVVHGFRLKGGAMLR